ncbi:hypothetical protein HOO68_03775 [Candidatus Gracilibacteria bacterium]|nr:hypothetical protein [Candidatus Gracilibacteria bacterium]
MSLFDELLTKSQPASTSNPSGGSGSQDPLSGPSIVINETTPVATVMDGVVMVPIEPPVTMSPDPIKKIPTSNDALIITNEENDASISIEKEEVVSDSVQNNSLFSMMDMPSSSVSIQEEVVAPKNNTEASFRDTNEYIEHAIEEVSELILSLDAADKAKLAEESQYEEQKEHFAELEIQAESEHQKILSERAHAEEMRVYLKKERVIKDEISNDTQEKGTQDDTQVIEDQQDEIVEEPEVPAKKKEWNGFKKKDAPQADEEPKEIFL